MKTGTFINTYGVIACGGKSSRMGTDKSLLRYHNKTQRQQVYELLTPFCEKVFISCNAAQAETMTEDIPMIPDIDRYGDIGPMLALVSAFSKYPDTNILLIGCDYPFLNGSSIAGMAPYCEDKPVAFFNKDTGMYEPLLAWYPATVFPEIKIRVEHRELSLQNFLVASEAVRIESEDKKCLMSADTYESYVRIGKQINRLKEQQRQI